MAASSTSVMPVNGARPPMIPWLQGPPSRAAYDQNRTALGPTRGPTASTPGDVLRRLRAAHPDRALVVLWDGAPYHRAGAVREVAAGLGITLLPLPGYSPDL